MRAPPFPFSFPVSFPLQAEATAVDSLQKNQAHRRVRNRNRAVIGSPGRFPLAPSVRGIDLSKCRERKRKPQSPSGHRIRRTGVPKDDAVLCRTAVKMRFRRRNHRPQRLIFIDLAAGGIAYMLMRSLINRLSIVEQGEASVYDGEQCFSGARTGSHTIMRRRRPCAEGNR